MIGNRERRNNYIEKKLLDYKAESLKENEEKVALVKEAH